MRKARSFGSGHVRNKPGDFLLSHTVACAVPSGLRSLTSVFGMGTGGSSSLGSPRTGDPRSAISFPLRNLPRADSGQLIAESELNIDGPCSERWRRRICVRSRDYGQAERAISNSQLNALLRLHIRPINVIVFHGSSGRSHLGEGFVLICIQHLS